ncbi:MAG: creatininase family protein [Rhodobacteraceae bacterium]|nr:creatininase family protein [Paracoccaceae bacterium]
MSARNWAELRAPDFAALPADTIALLPTAAVEQHGPHLPVGTDTIIAEGMLAELRRQCPEDLPLLILPVQAVGKSTEHLWAAGTLTLTAQTALAAWMEIGRAVARAGVRTLVIMNSHGGNAALNEILARELRIETGMRTIRAAWSALGTPPGMYSDRELRFGIHGGDYETSLMLHFAPGTVDMAAAADFASSAETTPLPPTGPLGYGWISTDLNPAGVAGEAHLATAAKGQATAVWQAARAVELLRSLRGW